MKKVTVEQVQKELLVIANQAGFATLEDLENYLCAAIDLMAESIEEEPNERDEIKAVDVMRHFLLGVK